MIQRKPTVDARSDLRLRNASQIILEPVARLPQRPKEEFWTSTPQRERSCCVEPFGKPVTKLFDFLMMGIQFAGADCFLLPKAAVEVAAVMGNPRSFVLSKISRPVWKATKATAYLASSNLLAQRGFSGESKEFSRGAGRSTFLINGRVLMGFPWESAGFPAEPFLGVTYQGRRSRPPNLPLR